MENPSTPNIDPRFDQAHSWLVSEWAAALKAVLDIMAQQWTTISWSAQVPDSAFAGELYWFEQRFTAATDARISVGANADVWRRMAERTGAGLEMECTADEDCRKVCEVVLAQAFEGLAHAISRQAEGEVACASRSDGPAPPVDTLPGFVELSFDNNSRCGLVVAVSRSLLDFLAGSLPEDATRTAEETPEARHLRRLKNLDLLLEVELPVSVSFGRTRLPVREVLKLGTGSIVELNCSISDHVEVAVNNHLIARGEVVVVEGNYGVRIQEISTEGKRAAYAGCLER